MPANAPASAADDLRLRCEVRTLSIGAETGDVTVPVTAPANALALQVKATVVGRAPDPNLANNVWEMPIALIRRFDLRVTYPAGNVLPLGEDVFVTLRVRNEGPSAARNVIVTSQIKGAVSYGTQARINGEMDDIDNPRCTMVSYNKNDAVADQVAKATW